MVAAALACAIFALGLHQEPKSRLPFFVKELQRKMFWYAYECDKTFATFFGRPPMISGKFCSCKMPLDLEYHQIGLEGEALEQALGELDKNGWNTRNLAIGRPRWLRTAVMTAQIREEILEISLGTDSSRLEAKAQCARRLTHV